MKNGILTEIPDRVAETMAVFSQSVIETRTLSRPGDWRRRRTLVLIFEAEPDGLSSTEIYTSSRLAASLNPTGTVDNYGEAECSSIEPPWSDRQAEGQINRLKTLKRAMYGRAGPELLGARMLPPLHTK